MSDDHEIRGGHALAEVDRLHDFFAEWFNGTCGDGDQEWRRVADVLDPSFEIVTPGGETLGREVLLEALRPMHGSRAAAVGFRIWIEKGRARELAPDLFLVSYEEWQEAPGAGEAAVGRQSTALIRNATAGFRWLHVHETWL